MRRRSASLPRSSESSSSLRAAEERAMAIQTQVPEFYVTGADLPFTKLGPIDIPADRGVVVDPGNDYAIQLPTTGGPVQGAIGFTMEKIPVNGTGRVRTLGVKRAFADGPITRGDDV